LDHDQSRKLASLAAIGQISLKEETELLEHLERCPECKQVQSDYHFIVSRQLALRSVASSERENSLNPGPLAAHMRDSFLARARAEGVHFSRNSERAVAPDRKQNNRVPAWLWMSAVAAIVLATGFCADVYLDRVRLERGAENLHVARAIEPVVKNTVPSQTVFGKNTGVSNSAFATLQQKIEDDEQREQKLMADLQTSHAAVSALTGQVAERDSQLADERGRADALEGLVASTSSDLTSRDARIAALTQSIEMQSLDLERERQLKEASKDVRQLMGARNLHIIDVRDVAGSQPSARAFGRVFYAEGQSLIFYAFDLPQKGRNPAKYTFEAWGQNDGHPSLVYCLGTFGVDDHDQQRWVLKVENPQLLGDVNSVFVTAESPADTRAPHGQKLLYAYLAGKPNHP
jgi:hypothetical protein